MANILIVDDEYSLLELISICLVRDGHIPFTAQSKTEVLRKLDEIKPDLIILDVMLGGDDGRELCNEIKHSDYGDVPILLYSAAPALLANFKEYHADDTLAKPFDITSLSEKVITLLAK